VKKGNTEMPHGNETDLRDVTYEDGGLLSAHEALRESQAHYQLTLNCMTDAIHVVDGNLKVVQVNNRFQEWMTALGLDHNPLGKHLFDAFPFLPDAVQEEYRHIFDSGESMRNEEAHLINGKAVLVEVRKIAIQEKNKTVRVLTILHDITETRRAEQALRASEERYRNILSSIQEGYYEVDLKGFFLFGNQALHRMLGCENERLEGKHFRRYYCGDHASEVYRLFQEALARRQPLQLDDWKFVRRDGSCAILSLSGTPIFDEAGAPVGFRGIIREVTQRWQAEEALRDSEERYRELLENANDIIYTHDLNGRFTSINKAAERVCGYSQQEALNLSIYDVVTPEYREEARRMAARKVDDKTSTRYELEIFSKSGQRVTVEVSTRIIMTDGRPVGIQGIARDISERRRADEERRRLEAQLQHAQKLEGLGVLAGGIAHDFNNLLVGMLGYAGLALVKLAPESPARSYVERIEATARRAAELTNQMLAYSGRGSFTIRPLNLNNLAEELARLLEASISKKVTLRFNHYKELPLIKGDAAQLHQVLMNLITNASDAIADNVGVITVQTSVVHADRTYLSSTYLDDDLPPGPYVCMEVSDTGCGMDKETLSRIFDPFFSTKFAGRGLGLAATLGIIRGHRGAIKVYSEPGYGSTFKVLLPVDQGDENRPAETAPPAGSEIDLWKSTGTILIADDEEMAREVAREACIEHGFDVLTAKDGMEAVEMYRQHRKQIVAVILDLMMPVMNGREAFIKIKAIEPGIPILLSSGYTEEDATTRIGGINPSGFVQKPYALDDMARRLKTVLEG